jgi:hypothetical protein
MLRPLWGRQGCGAAGGTHCWGPKVLLISRASIWHDSRLVGLAQLRRHLACPLPRGCASVANARTATHRRARKTKGVVTSGETRQSALLAPCRCLPPPVCQASRSPHQCLRRGPLPNHRPKPSQRLFSSWASGLPSPVVPIPMSRSVPGGQRSQAARLHKLSAGEPGGPPSNRREDHPPWMGMHTQIMCVSQNSIPGKGEESRQIFMGLSGPKSAPAPACRAMSLGLLSLPHPSR